LSQTRIDETLRPHQRYLSGDWIKPGITLFIVDFIGKMRAAGGISHSPDNPAPRWEKLG